MFFKIKSHLQLEIDKLHKLQTNTVRPCKQRTRSFNAWINATTNKGTV